MIPLGLSPADQRAFEAGLVSPGHAMRVTVQLLDMDQNILSVCAGRILSGQVDVDATADVWRTLSLEILDQDHALNLDTGRPDEAGVFLDRMIRVIYGVKSPQLPRWVEVPIFTGPIATLSRDNDTVSLTANGKESLLQVPSSRSQVWKRGGFKTTVLRELLAAGGELFTDIPAQSTKTTKDVALAPTSPIWPLAQSVARSWSAGMLAYDGRGYAKLYPPNASTRWTFRKGDGGSLSSMPKLAYSMDDFRNLVVVTGGIPKGGKVPVTATATAPAAHPLSGQNLGRGGVPRYFREDVQDDTITDQKAAATLAATTLQQKLTAAVQVDFDALPIPHLEPFDTVAVDVGTWSWRMQLLKFTIPLTSGDSMAVGRNVTTKTARRPRAVPRRTPRKTTPTRKAAHR